MTSTFNACLQQALIDVLLSRLDDGISQTPLDIYVRCAKLEKKSQEVESRYGALKEEDARLTTALATSGSAAGGGEAIVEKLQRLAQGLEEVDSCMRGLKREKRSIEREVKGWVEGRLRVIAREIKDREEQAARTAEGSGAKVSDESRRDSGMEMPSVVEKKLQDVREETAEEVEESVDSDFSIDLILPADGKI